MAIATIKAKNIAAAIPLEVKSKIPENNPKTPSWVAAATALWVKECPKLEIGNIAPAPAKSTNLSYRPNASNNDPSTTNNTTVWTGNNFKTSRHNWAIKHIVPPIKKAYKKIIRSSFLKQ